jgi:probable rRNA maturation factor
VIEVEVFGAGLTPAAPAAREVERLCVLATASAGIADGHLAIEYVDAATIARLNGEHRGKPEPTDVLSFPIDGADPTPPTVRAQDGASDDAGDRHSLVGNIPSAGAPRELGDVIICPEHTVDLREAIVHGVLHLVGMDHETDHGEMLALQAQLLEGARS